MHVSDRAQNESKSLARRLGKALFAPIGIAPLAWFRILFGALACWEIVLFFRYDFIRRYYIEAPFHFTYYGFGWVQPLPETALYVHFAVLAVLALMISVGLFTRTAAALFGAGFAYVFLLEKARYMNHFYLMILLSLILACLPAGKALSLDALRRPDLRLAAAPAWTLRLLQFQVGLVYFFGGVAKLYPDWLSGTVMREMLAYKGDFPLLGPWFGERWLILLFSYGALAFDLAVYPLLLFRRTRVVAGASALLFHFMNSFLFRIDVFPWLMGGATLILFFPDWLPLRKRIAQWAGASVPPSSKGAKKQSLRAAVPVLSASEPGPLNSRQRMTLLALGLYAILQLTVPLRHYLYPGDAAWTDEGSDFSWRMLMRVKVGHPPRFPVAHALKGKVHRGEIPLSRDPEFWRHHWQARKMLLDPDLVLQFCQRYANELKEQGAERVDVRAIVPVSLNGREPQLLIDPNVNLAEAERSLWPKPWIRPFDPTKP